MPDNNPMTDLTQWMAEVNHHLASGPYGMSSAARRQLDGYVDRIRAAATRPAQAPVDAEPASEEDGEILDDLYSGSGSAAQEDGDIAVEVAPAKATKAKD